MRRQVMKLSPEGWKRRVELVNNSPNSLERDSVFFGHFDDCSPALLPMEVLNLHLLSVGAPGSGKTTVATQVATQIIWKRRFSLVVLDLKPDLAMWNSCFLEADRVQMRRRHFTIEPGEASHVLNAFRQKAWRESNRPLVMLGDQVANILGVASGSEYGESHFATANLRMLVSALCANPNPKSLRELYKEFENRRNFKDIDVLQQAHGADVEGALRLLADFTALNISEENTPRPEVLREQIELDDLFCDPQLLYVALPSMLSPDVTGRIARMVLRLLLDTAHTHRGPRVQVYCFIDEAARMVNSNIADLLEQARSHGVGCWFSSQTLSQYQRKYDLVPLLRACAGAHLYFTPADMASRQLLMDESVEVIEREISTGTSETVGQVPGGATWSMSQSFMEKSSLGPELRINDLREITAEPFRYLLLVPQNRGLAQYNGAINPVTFSFHISKDEYERRMALGFPAGSAATVLQGEVEEIAQSGARDRPPKTRKGKRTHDDFGRWFEDRE